MNATHLLHCDGKDINNKSASSRMACEVFLGGSCNPTTWRSEIAIPTLQKLGITYYNPQVSQWGPELIAQEYEAKQTAKVLLFVIDNQTRNSAGIIEAAQLAATRRESLILVIYPYRQGQTILGETVSIQEYCDLMNGLLVLQYLMEKQRIPIFESVSVALNCTSKVLREEINVQDLHSEDGIRPIKISFNQNGIDLVILREIFKSMDMSDSGSINLEEAWIALQSSVKCNVSSMSELLSIVNKSETYRSSIDDGFLTKRDPTELRINFEQFCALATESSWRMKSNGVSCESEIPSVWSILCRKATKFLRRAIVQPFNRFLDWTNFFVPESEKRDLYIGVIGKDQFWLETTAIPSIESIGLSLYRSSLNEYNVRVLPQELQRMKNSRLILLIVPQHSRGITIMALAAHLIGLRAKLVLCIQMLPEDCVVSGEKLTEQGIKDYNRGRMYLSDYASREGTWLLARQKTMATQSVDPYPITTDSTNRRKTDNCGKLLIQFLLIYWKSFVIILWPLILLPIFIIETTEVKAMRCLYVIGLMAMFWMTEVLPLPITGLIPIFLYPLMGIMSTGDTCMCYMNDTTMMFIGSMVIAIVIENSGLHIRIALLIIKLIGCSHRRLTLGLFCVTMFLSMWISNTAATTMMLPIVEIVLLELEAQGLGDMFIREENNCEENVESSKKPTHITMTYYLVTAYASSLGGVGTLVGTGTNLTLKGFFEKRFPNSSGISLTSWMLYSVPPMLLMGFLTWLWLQVMYMGMFRPGSKDAKATNIGKQGEKVAATVIEKRYKELGPITWHEFSVGLLFLVVVLLWFFRNPGFVRGWPTYITDLHVKDSTAAAGVTLLFFILPSKLDFLRSFDADPVNRPTKPSPGMITWKMINTKMHWSLILVLGGGFAISAGSTSSNLSSILGNALTVLKSINPFAILFIVCLFAETITELTSNVAIANIILPVLAEMCIALRIHPLYLMLPASLCCSFSFHLPVGTPPNTIAITAGHIKTRDFAIAGIGPSIITLLVTIFAFSTWGTYIFNLSEFPDWAT
ncbi:protein I'm not dead yet isoform X4 [Apis mellifera]|nr:protein I'm not dead yet isoform X4 [Apis mellifera]XP_006559633.1 protein I'm not dead yet isoform X4 [Apis mellifera]XP_016768872.1 protein I'm not dead yet isoform X4 [Apis mellifera]|eukprot:XP_006559632.1 protein I'm not dead yet isoform X4 [Apis mellifera]